MTRYDGGTVGRRLTVGALAWLCGSALQLVSGAALADEAEDKYDEGREAAAEGDQATACKRFAESAKLESNARVQLALADCKAELGLLLDEREHLAAALELLDEGDARRAQVNARIDMLARRVPQLTVRLPEDAPEGAIVSIDGKELDDDELGTPIELNPGEHRVTAQAPGQEAADVGVVVRPGDSIEITAVLNPEQKLELVAPAPAPAPEPAPERGWNPMPLGITFTVIGATSLVAAAITGGMYLHDRAIVEEECDGDDLCSLEGLDAADRAEVLGTVSTVTAIGGGALAAAGVAIMIGAAVSGSDDEGDTASLPAFLPTVSPEVLGLTYSGSF